MTLTRKARRRGLLAAAATAGVLAAVTGVAIAVPDSGSAPSVHVAASPSSPYVSSAAPPSPSARTATTTTTKATAATTARASASSSPSSVGQVLPVGPAKGTGAPIPIGTQFYVDPGNNAAKWVSAHPTDPRAAAIEAGIGNQSTAAWFGGWSGNITNAVSAYVGAAADAHQVPVLVAYDIPDRDCGGDSAGGAATPAAYQAWISGFVAGLGGRPAIVVVEPDALAMLGCLPDDAARSTRVALLHYAAQQFHDVAPQAQVYLDGGSPNWIAPATMAQRLDAAGVGLVRGFSVNVSNFFTTAQSEAYASPIVSALSGQFHVGAKFVVDVSRNGAGETPGQWCNPASARLGVTSRNGDGVAEYLLRVKMPGDSDGTCGSAPASPAGQFDPAVAAALVGG